MASKFLWKVGGEAGYGILTTGMLMSRIAIRSGYHVCDYTEYPSLIRGGHNTFEMVISDEEVGAIKQPIDMLVCLNMDTYNQHEYRIHDETLVIYDSSMFRPSKDGNLGSDNPKGILIDIPIKKILLEDKAPFVMANILTIGASMALLGADKNIYQGLIQEKFGKKGEKIVQSNIDMLQKGYQYVEKHYSDKKRDVLSKREKFEEKMVVQGNEAFGMAALVADCRLYSGYPMTPASSVLTYLAGMAEKTGIIVRHVEDEISAINVALGSSFAGVRSATGSSGGGFALMVESISFAGIAEIPIVIFLAQRGGPATGMPTWTEHADLLFAVHAGHGDFPKIVLAPGDQEEMFELTLKAFDLTDIYQTPVIVLSDKLLSESRKSVKLSFWDKLTKEHTPDRGKIVEKVDDPENYLRYKLVDDGISPMLVPGQEGAFYQANSYEHVEDGHTTEEMSVRIEQAGKRHKKIDTYFKNHFDLPTVFGDLDKADTVFVSWGTNKGAILEAMKDLKEKGTETAYIHFTHVYPLDRPKVEKLFEAKKEYVLVENNQTGQFGKLLRQETGVDLDFSKAFFKFDGRPIFFEELVEHIKKS